MHDKNCFWIVYVTAIKGLFGYIDASIWQHGGQLEWEKPLHQMVMDIYT